MMIYPGGGYPGEYFPQLHVVRVPFTQPLFLRAVRGRDGSQEVRGSEGDLSVRARASKLETVRGE